MMKFFFIPALALGLTVCSGASDLETLLPVLPRRNFKMADGSNIVIIRNNGRDKLYLNKMTPVAELGKNEVVAQVVQNRNKTALLCLLRTHTGKVIYSGESGHLGFDYSGLGLISKVKGNWILARLWLPPNDRQASVIELGRINGDGTEALLKIGYAPARRSTYNIIHEWETWDLFKKKRIKRGFPD